MNDHPVMRANGALYADGTKIADILGVSSLPTPVVHVFGSSKPSNTHPAYFKLLINQWVTVGFSTADRPVPRYEVDADFARLVVHPMEQCETLGKDRFGLRITCPVTLGEHVRNLLCDPQLANADEILVPAHKDESEREAALEKLHASIAGLVVGPPVPCDGMSTEQLEAQGIVGLYRPKPTS
jgi:hypothetical protein